jgi:futalosine hydrolase
MGVGVRFFNYASFNEPNCIIHVIFTPRMNSTTKSKLLVMATKLEAMPILQYFDQDEKNFRCYEGKGIWENWTLLITGVGMVNTALHLSVLLAGNSFAMAVNAGVAGSFVKDLPLATVYKINHDFFPELGAEYGADFLNLNDLGINFAEQAPMLSDNAAMPYTDESVFPDVWHQLPACSSATVNTAHGNDVSIKRFQALYNSDLESMEGAAFFLTCAQYKLPYIQIRAVSNYIEQRNVQNWRMKQALDNLGKVLNEGAKILLS